MITSASDGGGKLVSLQECSTETTSRGQCPDGNPSNLGTWNALPSRKIRRGSAREIERFKKAFRISSIYLSGVRVPREAQRGKVPPKQAVEPCIERQSQVNDTYLTSRRPLNISLSR